MPQSDRDNRLQSYYRLLSAILGGCLGLMVGAAPLFLLNNPSSFAVLTLAGMGAIMGITVGLRFPNIVDAIFWIVSWFLPV